MSSITVEERADSRKTTNGKNPSHERTYNIRGTESEDDALQALRDYIPGTVGDALGGSSVLVLQSWSVEPVTNIEGSERCNWQGTANYCAPDKAEKQVGDEPTYTFDTSGGTEHITQSRSTASATCGYIDPDPDGDGSSLDTTPPDFKGAINVTKDSVDGVDITVPVYNFQETHALPDSQVTQAYKMKVMELTGKVNTAPFRGFAAWEVLFLGASGQKKGDDKWELSFKFAAQKNKTNIRFGDPAPGDGFTVPAKYGWQYLWVKYKERDDKTAKCRVLRPLAAYVENVYDGGDFSELGIGTK